MEDGRWKIPSRLCRFHSSLAIWLARVPPSASAICSYFHLSTMTTTTMNVVYSLRSNGNAYTAMMLRWSAALLSTAMLCVLHIWALCYVDTHEKYISVPSSDNRVATYYLWCFTPSITFIWAVNSQNIVAFYNEFSSVRSSVTLTATTNVFSIRQPKSEIDSLREEKGPREWATINIEVAGGG